MGKLAAVAANGSGTVDMETEYLNLGLDIIGLGVFNYNFGSITSESPVIQVGKGLAQPGCSTLAGFCLRGVQFCAWG